MIRSIVRHSILAILYSIKASICLGFSKLFNPKKIDQLRSKKLHRALEKILGTLIINYYEADEKSQMHAFFLMKDINE